MQGTESDLDQRDERVIRGGDDYILREEVTQRYRFPILRWNFRSKKRVSFRCDTIFLSTKEFPDGLRRRVSLLGNSVISLVRHETLENANLLVEEKGHEPYDGRESRRHCAREEVRVLLQKFVVAEQVGEPFCRTRKCSPDDGSIPKTRSQDRGKLKGSNKARGRG